MVAVSKISWKAMYLEHSHSVSIHTHAHSGAHRHDGWWQLQVVAGMRWVPAREFISVSRGLLSLSWGAGRGGLWEWNLWDEITAAEWTLRWQIDLFLKPFFFNCFRAVNKLNSKRAVYVYWLDLGLSLYCLLFLFCSFSCTKYFCISKALNTFPTAWLILFLLPSSKFLDWSYEQLKQPTKKES